MWLQHLDQSISSFAASLGPTGEAFLRLTLAAVAGGLVGLERELRGRQAGFRTNLLVCLGSCLTMLVSLHFATHQWTAQGPGVNLSIDPSRIAYGVMTGVGFLGAGAIVRAQSEGAVRGLTTAAALWCVAAVGLGMGFGMYTVSSFATLIVVAALWILDVFEDWLPKTRYRTITVRRPWAPNCISQTVQHFKDAKLDVVDASFERSDDLKSADISLKIAFVNREQYYAFEHNLEGNGVYQLMTTKEL